MHRATSHTQHSYTVVKYPQGLFIAAISDHHHCYRSETRQLRTFQCIVLSASRTTSQALLLSHSHEFLCINHTRWLMWLSVLYFMMWVDMKSLCHWKKSWVSPAGEHSVCLPAQEGCLSLFIASFWWPHSSASSCSISHFISYSFVIDYKKMVVSF